MNMQARYKQVFALHALESARAGIAREGPINMGTSLPLRRYLIYTGGLFVLSLVYALQSDTAVTPFIVGIKHQLVVKSLPLLRIARIR